MPAPTVKIDKRTLEPEKFNSLAFLLSMKVRVLPLSQNMFAEVLLGDELPAVSHVVCV